MICGDPITTNEFWRPIQRLYDFVVGDSTGFSRTHACVPVLQVYCLQFDLATNRLVSGARDRQIFVWDFEKGDVIKKLSGHRHACVHLGVGSLLLTEHTPKVYRDEPSVRQ